MANIASILAEAQEESGRVVVLTFKKPNGGLLLGPDGEPCTVSILGPYSPSYMRVERAQQQSMLRRAQGGWSDLTLENVMSHRIEQAAAAVTDFSGWEEDGAPLPYNAPNLRKLLAVEIVLSQVEQGIKRHALLWDAQQMMVKADG
jgi:hypothetical protein